jgi:outer membrane protein assembly factor BamA
LLEAMSTRGFPEAEITPRIVRLQPAENGTERRAVVFDVDEGTRFVVKEIELRGGDPALAEETLAALSACRDAVGKAQNEKRVSPAACKDGPLRVAELDADSDRVRALYAANGYPNVRALIEAAFAPAGETRLRVTITPHEGRKLEKAVLGEVFVQGNTTTNADVLRRELGVTAKDEGAPLDPLAIQKGVSRIRRSGLYSRVNLDYVGLDEPEVPVDVIVRVEEKPSLSVDSSIGFSTERLFSLGLEVKEKNAFGSMIELGGIVDYGLFIGRATQLQLPARWPRILGTDLAAAFTPFASYRDESSGVKLDGADPVAGAGDAFLGAGPRRRIAATGAALSLDYAVNQIDALTPDKLTIGVAYELRSEWANLDAKPYRPFDGEYVATVAGLTDTLRVEPARIAALTPRVLFSDIDNPFDPLEGAAAEVLFKALSSLWLAEDWFGVLGARGAAYTTFGERVTLAGRVGMRWGFAADDKPCGECRWALMQSDLLLLGGERSVRGYGENTIGVRSPLYTPRLEPLDASGPRPGLFGAQASGEVRVLAYKNLGIGDLKPAVFVDAGMSTDDPRRAHLLADRLAARELGLSVGAGLRYVMPVGPALLDCAISPIDRTAANVPVAGCHLALGYTF